MGQLVELNASVEADSARSLQILRVERLDAPFAVERAMNAEVLDNSGSYSRRRPTSGGRSVLGVIRPRRVTGRAELN